MKQKVTHLVSLEISAAFNILLVYVFNISLCTQEIVSETNLNCQPFSLCFESHCYPIPYISTTSVLPWPVSQLFLRY